MKFTKQYIIKKRDLAEIIKEYNGFVEGGDWIFRALDHKGEPKKSDFEIPIPSSFDKAWESRIWSTTVVKRWRYEAWMLREFKRAAFLYHKTLPASTDYLEWLALARHFGMPSRLVDFTYSFYVALYFALSGKEKDTHAFILALNLKKLKEKTEAKLSSWRFSSCNRDRDFHNPVIFRQFAFENRPLWVVPLAPSRRNERLLNQQGLFLCPGQIEKGFEENLSATLAPGEDLQLICLHPDLRTNSIKFLRKMNIDMHTLYPDLSGFAQSLRDLVHLDIDDKDRRFENELKRSISAEPWC